MSPERRKRLCESFPALFSGHIISMDCGNGWYPIVYTLSQALASNPEARVAQIKEKFGGLRYYVDGVSGDEERFICAAENASFEICEECGAPGRLRDEPRGRWLKTFCDACDDSYLQRRRGK